MSISLSTANVIYAWAYPVVIIGILLTSAGTLALFYVGNALTRQAAYDSRPAPTRQAAAASPSSLAPTPVEVARAEVGVATPPATAASTPAASPQPQPTGSQLRPMLNVARLGDAATAEAPATEAPPPAEDRAGWRGLSLRQQAGMRAILSGAPGEVWLMTEEDPEAQHYAEALAQVFSKSGWTERRSLIPTKGSLHGLAFVRDASTPDWAIKRAFDIAGLPLVARGRAGDEPAPAIYIGARTPKS